MFLFVTLVVVLAAIISIYPPASHRRRLSPIAGSKVRARAYHVYSYRPPAHTVVAFRPSIRTHIIPPPPSVVRFSSPGTTIREP